MDGSMFDRLARVFGEPRSRRGALAALGGMFALGADAGARSRRRSGARTSSADKIAVCHYDKEMTSYKRISVSSRSRKAHQSHGDFLYGDCCSPDHCDPGQTCSFKAGNLDTPSACACDAAACKELGGVCTSGGACELSDACYWMSVPSYEWVPSPIPAPTIEACRLLDSCAIGGGGESQGGCYRWQTATGTVIAPCKNDWDDTSCTP